MEKKQGWKTKKAKRTINSVSVKKETGGVDYIFSGYKRFMDNFGKKVFTKHGLKPTRTYSEDEDIVELKINLSDKKAQEIGDELESLDKSGEGYGGYTANDKMSTGGGVGSKKMAKKDLEKYKYYLSKEEELSNAYDEAELEYGEDSDDAKDAWSDLGSHLKSMRTFEKDMIKQYGKDFHKQYDSYVDGKMKHGGQMARGGGVDDSNVIEEMSEKQLDKIKNAKPGDIVKVQSKWLPYKLVSVKVLEPFKQIHPDFYEDFYAAYGDYDGSLERIGIDYQEKAAFIGGNWEEEVNDSEIIKMAKKYNLKHHHMAKGGGTPVDFLGKKVKIYKYHLDLTHDEVELIASKLKWFKIFDEEGTFEFAYSPKGDDGSQYVANDGIRVYENYVDKVNEVLKETGLDRVTKITEDETFRYATGGGVSNEQLSESKIREAIAESGKMRVSDIMSYLKRRYDGRYDVRLAKQNAVEMIKDMKYKTGGGVEGDDVNIKLNEFKDFDFENDSEFLVKIKDSVCKIRKGRMGNWIERLVYGEEPYGFGSKSYQSYLDKDEIISWLMTDYRYVDEINSLSELEEAFNSIESNLYESDNENDKMARGGFLEGREEYEGYRFDVWYRAPRGYSVSGADDFTKKIFNNEQIYFETKEDAVEHAEISIRSVTEDYEMAKGGGVKSGIKTSELLSFFKKETQKRLGVIQTYTTPSSAFGPGTEIARISKSGDKYYYELNDGVWVSQKSFDTLKDAEDYIKTKWFYENAIVKKMKTGGGVGYVRFNTDNFWSNIDTKWDDVSKITSDIKTFLITAYEASGDELTDDIISAIEKGIKAFEIYTKDK